MKGNEGQKFGNKYYSILDTFGYFLLALYAYKKKVNK